jgi:hypothetical protein
VGAEDEYIRKDATAEKLSSPSFSPADGSHYPFASVPIF